jgi:protein-tyrosine phosphatase
MRDLTDLDLEYIEQLDRYSIIDFRSEWERKEAPDRLPQQHEIKTLALPITPNNSSEAAQEISERVSKGDIKGLDAMELITGDYRRFVIIHTHHYRQFFQELLGAAGRPVLFHCTADKDRTGFAAALTLHLLGVPKADILKDYLLSNLYYLPSYRGEIENFGMVP